MQIVWYFDKPTIGYCKECDCTAIYDDEHGLSCPTDTEHDISVFEYNGDGPFPE
jgi:hypothetical protein